MSKKMIDKINQEISQEQDDQLLESIVLTPEIMPADFTVSEKLLSNPRILQEIEKRKAIALQAARVTKDMVLGATVLRAFASVDDALDEKGNFSIDKARETGVIHHIRKFQKKDTKWGEDVSFELYSNESAQEKLANYLGMDVAPAENSQRESLRSGVEEVARALAQGQEPTQEQYAEAFAQVKAWALERGAQYSTDTILRLEQEYNNKS